jgi:hypothetical protein
MAGNAFSVNIDFNNTPQVYIDTYGEMVEKAADLWTRILVCRRNKNGTLDETSNGIVITFDFAELGESTLAHAGPQNLTFDGGKGLQDIATIDFCYTVNGFMEFNTRFYPENPNDPNNTYIQNHYYKNFYPVCVHEMGHVLGFGTLWNSSIVDLLTYYLEQIPILGPVLVQHADRVNHVIENGNFIGEETLSAWRECFPGHEFDTYVPIEDEGGSGTLGSHWDEVEGEGGLTGIRDYLDRDMAHEVLTGWASANTDIFMSKITPASFYDIGFSVDYSILNEMMGLTVEEPIITRQPEEAIYTVGDTIFPISVEANSPDNGTISYLWIETDETGQDIIDGPSIESSFTPTFDVAGIKYFYVQVTNTKRGNTESKSKNINSDLVAIELKNKIYRITKVGSIWLIRQG